VVLAGNRAKNIDDVEPVEAVFNDGIGYDAAKLMCSDMMGLRWWLDVLILSQPKRYFDDR
jgi:hypothetical protein